MRGTGTTILAATVVVLALAGCTQHTDRADSRTDTGTTRAAAPTPTATAAVAAAARFHVLDRAFASSDALPDGAAAPEDLEVDSQRRVGESDGTTYWVATTTHAAVCLIGNNPAADSTDNFSVCGEVPGTGDSVVTSTSDDRGHTTALVADGFQDHGTDALRELVPNVWVR
ncbi:hypothetical protein ABC270_05395 [Curtobacterium sp. 1P10AnD]|uniref:hypothetical protein n=1 Tax=Curtobacterium sp. 1P10AnD TaxID=3132283 RepID=UPI0039A376F7